MTSPTVRRTEFAAVRSRAALMTPIGCRPSITTNAGAVDEVRIRLPSYTVVLASSQPRSCAFALIDGPPRRGLPPSITPAGEGRQGRTPLARRDSAEPQGGVMTTDLGVRLVGDDLRAPCIDGQERRYLSL